MAAKTGHWPRWDPEHGHARGRMCRAHCPCMNCLGPAIGTLGTALDDAGNEVPGSLASHTGAQIRDADDRDMPWEERPFAWFRRMLEEGGCVITDNRPCEGIWPRGVRHDDAFFGETGESAYASPTYRPTQASTG